jgi:hypothetical protein
MTPAVDALVWMVFVRFRISAHLAESLAIETSPSKLEVGPCPERGFV